MRWSFRCRAATVCLEGVPGSGKRGDVAVRFPLSLALGRLALGGSLGCPRIVAGDGDNSGPGAASVVASGVEGARAVDDAGGWRRSGLLPPDGSVTVWFAVVGAARLGGRRIHASSPWEGWVVGGRSPRVVHQPVNFLGQSSWFLLGDRVARVLVMFPRIRFLEGTCVAFPLSWIRRGACAGWLGTARFFVRLLLPAACAHGPVSVSGRRVSSVLFSVVPLKKVVGGGLGFCGGECGDRARRATPVFRW